MASTVSTLVFTVAPKGYLDDRGFLEDSDEYFAALSFSPKWVQDGAS